MRGVGSREAQHLGFGHRLHPDPRRRRAEQSLGVPLRFPFGSRIPSPAIQPRTPYSRRRHPRAGTHPKAPEGWDPPALRSGTSCFPSKSHTPSKKKPKQTEGMPKLQALPVFEQILHSSTKRRSAFINQRPGFCPPPGDGSTRAPSRSIARAQPPAAAPPAPLHIRNTNAIQPQHNASAFSSPR